MLIFSVLDFYRPWVYLYCVYTRAVRRERGVNFAV